MADTRNIHRLGYINVNEEHLFSTIADVMNACFGKKWSGYQRSYIPLDDGSGYVVWFPAMAKKRGNEFVPFSKTSYRCAVIAIVRYITEGMQTD